MKRIIIFLVVLSFCGNNLSAQDEKLGRDLNAQADDMRYGDAAYFIKLNRPEKAFELLHEYLEIFPRGAHRHEAYMHIAEIYKKRFDYAKAAAVYLKVYEEFSAQDEGITAYFEAAICYKKMGYDKRATEIFREIADEKPDTIHAGRARTQLEILSIVEDIKSADKAKPVENSSQADNPVPADNPQVIDKTVAPEKTQTADKPSAPNQSPTKMRLNPVQKTAAGDKSPPPDGSLIQKSIPAADKPAAEKKPFPVKKQPPAKKPAPEKPAPVKDLPAVKPDEKVTPPADLSGNERPPIKDKSEDKKPEEKTSTPEKLIIDKIIQ